MTKIFFTDRNKIGIQETDIKRSIEKRTLFCPYVTCKHDFKETGNLKSHLRS